MAPHAGKALRLIRNDLHAAGNSTSGMATASGVGGSRWTTKALRELLDEGLPNVVNSDVDRVSHAKDDQ